MYGLVRPNRIYADWYDVQVPIYENNLFHTSTPNHSSSKLSLQHSIHPSYRIQNSPHRTRGNQPRDSNRTQLHQQTGKGGVAYSGAITTTGRGRAGTEARRSLRQSRLRQKGGVKRTGTTGELAPNMAPPKATQRSGNAAGDRLTPMALSTVFGAKKEDMETDSPHKV